MTQNIILDYKIDLKKFEKISFVLIYAIIAFYFLVNGPGLLPGWNETWTYSTIIYLVGVSLFLKIQEDLPIDMEKPVSKIIFGFGLSFLLSTAIFTVLYESGWYFQDVTPISTNLLVGMLVYQLVIVCTSEEIIFRGVIYRYLRKYFNVYIPMLISAFIFSIFHFVAYNGNLFAMLVAFIMGIIFALCVEKWNLGVSIGLHFAWNAFVLGITLFN